MSQRSINKNFFFYFPQFIVPQEPGFVELHITKALFKYDSTGHIRFSIRMKAQNLKCLKAESELKQEEAH